MQIDPNNLVDARVSVVLMKFLRARCGEIHFFIRRVIIFWAARNLNPTAASEMFVATLRWRDEFKVDDAVKEEFPQDVYGQLGHIYGRDKDGRPVVQVHIFRNQSS